MQESFRKQMEKSKTTTNKMLFAEHIKDFQQKLINIYCFNQISFMHP